MDSSSIEPDYFCKAPSFVPPEHFYWQPAVVRTRGGLHSWPSMVIAGISGAFEGELYVGFHSGQERKYLDPRHSPLAVLSACISHGAKITFHAEPKPDGSHARLVDRLVGMVGQPEFPDIDLTMPPSNLSYSAVM